ncbi:hypothetical protein RUM43_006421 [Polyplax serrata]|uniref:PPM-type phosphatase domain-containing protein n=1 Tax=Polyplax serrata TaxID=468196 RepID=A0AAN8PBE3_POLSC
MDQLYGSEIIKSAFPDVQCRTITPEWEFIVMACDGIWDVMTNESTLGGANQNLGH